MRILVFSTLFPNAASPGHGVFVENRLTAFRRKYAADIRVVAPVAWFPFRHPAFGAYAAAARAPERETRQGLEIFHPRYLIPPKAAMSFAPGALERCLEKAARAMIADGWDFDLIDAHYFYPDGVAATRVARRLGKPVAVTARGTDVNLIPRFEKPRALVVDAAWRADAVITVAAALKDELIRLGAPEEKITVLRNGVDLDAFRPVDREQARAAYGVDGLVLASVGHLIDRKGHDLVIDALRDIDGATLLIAGEGPMRQALEKQCRDAGLAGRVRFLGRVPHQELRQLYGAADILILASSREGWPNVLLEAMACGTPCVATNVWGSGEVIRAPEAGRLAEARSADAIAGAVKALAASPPARAATRRYAEDHSWDATADGMARIFATLAEKSQAQRRQTTTPIDLARAGDRPRLLVTIDTEEQFDWRRFDAQQYTVNDPSGLERFQAICEAAGARPLYFLTTPLLRDRAMADFFRALAARGAADCGLHLHQWTTPPEGHYGEFHSFQKNLPFALHRDKLASIAADFERVFGRRARSHRAGRYGIGPECYGLLAEIGVDLDFSPSACFDFSASGGPDFSAMSNTPFRIDGEDWRVAVTPVCGESAIRKTPFFVGVRNCDPGFSLPRRSLMPKRVVKPARLSPEGMSLREMKSLTRRLLADRTPVLTVSLHSTSLSPGGSPYAADAAGVDALLATFTDYLAWSAGELGCVFTSLPDLARLYGMADDV